MPNRRTFMTGAAAAAIGSSMSWADAGMPSYLAAARMPDQSYRLFGLDQDVRPLFSRPLPARGHAAAGHPTRPEAIAFARRPGTYALVVNCVTASTVAKLSAPAERHFYGHGVFSEDGARLYTTENAFEIGEGRIGIWAADDGYARVGEFRSGGIGPHDITRLPDTDILVVANGGIDTHPDTGREKLNIPTMRPNLTYLSTTGEMLDQVELPPEMHQNSIRHLSVRQDGLVAFGCQWQGDLADVPPLIGTHRRGQPPALFKQPDPEHRALTGYIGSIAFSADGRTIGFTAPRGDRAEFFNLDTGWQPALMAEDVCGIAPSRHGHVLTTGLGVTGHANSDLVEKAIWGSWDNHMVSIQAELSPTS